MDLTTEVPFLSLNENDSSATTVKDAISSTTSSETDVAVETTVSAETFLGQVETVDGFLVSGSDSTSIPRIIFPSDPLLKGRTEGSEMIHGLG